jgi:2-hydroxychromene-2-carboxylate isomerase
LRGIFELTGCDMRRSVEYYFSMHSPWAYIGHVAFLDLMRRVGANVTYKPISLPKVFAETGGLPVTKRHPARLRYRMIELQRWREKRRLNFKLRPKFFPFEAELADRFVIAMAAAGYDPDSFLRRAFAALWEDEQDLADDTTLITLADATGLPGEKLLAAARRPEAKSTYDKNAEDAIAADVIGSPAYVLDGEVFWGQDRIDLLEDALKSGRGRYQPDGR